MKPRSLFKRHEHPHATRQQGVVLVLSLIMLVLMTIVGIAGIRGISTQERMVGQSYDRTLSFQAAEAALREAEIKIEANNQPAPVPSTPCALTGTAPNQLMVCGLITPTVQRWMDTAFTGWTNAAVVGTAQLVITPQYFVEYLGSDFPCNLNTTTISSNCKRYRVTARANPDSERSTVMLQTVYATFKQ
jgi:type IV pilus assembly protein PilX